MAGKGKIDKMEIKTIVKETITELFTDTKFVDMITKSIQSKVDEDIKKVKEIVEKNVNKITYLESRLDIFEQNEKLNNICIFGVKEENREVLNSKVLNIINHYTDLNYASSDITISYRIGSRQSVSKKSRPIVVKFKSIEKKHTLLKNCGKFKGSKLFVSEDLTKPRLQLLNEVKSAVGKENVWSYNGIIYTKINNKIEKIRSNEDLLKIVN